MRSRVLIILVVLIALGCVAWWWQAQTNDTPKKADHESATLPHQPKTQPSRDVPNAEKAELARKSPAAPESAGPNQLKEWVESLVTLCLRREKPQARELYLQLRTHKAAIADFVRAKYDEVGKSEAKTTTDHDAKLTALAYLALLRPQEDFMALLEPLRKHWRKPLDDDARRNAWGVVEKKYISATADEALPLDDKVFANVVAFIVGEQLRESDVDSLKYATACLLTVAPGDEGKELPDPWLSAILAHCGRELGLSPEPTKKIFREYLRAVTGEFSYSLRLRHQAKLLMVNQANSVFELLELIGNSLSGSDAAKAIVDYLQNHDVDTVTWQLIVEGLTAKWGTHGVSLMLSLAFMGFTRLQDLNYARSLAGVMLDSAAGASDVHLARLQAIVLDSLLLHHRRIWRKAHPGQDSPPTLLDQLGYSAKEAIRKLMRNVARDPGAASAARPGLCNAIFELPDALEVKIELLKELFGEPQKISYGDLYSLTFDLSLTSPDELIAQRAGVVALVENVLTRGPQEPTKTADGKTAAINTAECSLAAQAVSSVASLLKLLGYPPMNKPSTDRISQLRTFYLRTPNVTKTGKKSSLSLFINDAESAFAVLIDAGYSLKN